MYTEEKIKNIIREAIIANDSVLVYRNKMHEYSNIIKTHTQVINLLKYKYDVTTNETTKERIKFYLNAIEKQKPDAPILRQLYRYTYKVLTGRHYTQDFIY